MEAQLDVGHLAQLLLETTAADAGRIAAAEARLNAAAACPGFGLALLACISAAGGRAAEFLCTRESRAPVCLLYLLSSWALLAAAPCATERLNEGK